MRISTVGEAGQTRGGRARYQCGRHPGSGGGDGLETLAQPPAEEDLLSLYAGESQPSPLHQVCCSQVTFVPYQDYMEGAGVVARTGSLWHSIIMILLASMP